MFTLLVRKTTLMCCLFDKTQRSRLLDAFGGKKELAQHLPWAISGSHHSLTYLEGEKSITEWTRGRHGLVVPPSIAMPTFAPGTLIQE